MTGAICRSGTVSCSELPRPTSAMSAPLRSRIRRLPATLPRLSMLGRVLAAKAMVKPAEPVTTSTPIRPM
jgi:hypothetical protein